MIESNVSSSDNYDFATYERLPHLYTCTVAVIGLGYVGLPLAVEFANQSACVQTGVSICHRVIGFDIYVQRLEELRNGNDRTREVSAEVLNKLRRLEYTNDASLLAEADVFVVTVPTPIDSANRPNLDPLQKATSTVGRAIRERAHMRNLQNQPQILPVVIIESTVYPGATQEICIPILEIESGLQINKGFVCGYSPERINPGDRLHKLTSITKITSGSTEVATDWVDNFYGTLIAAGTHKAPSLAVAEAAKVIENTQRDLNIALMNELAIIFSHMGIDTLDVLEAAGTKWNFLPFRPGLVGGHCISVDPYYLTYQAERLGYHPQIVLAGRRINDSIGRWIVEQLVFELCRKLLPITETRVLVLGLTFKEDCPDIRNSRVVDVVRALLRYGFTTVLVDPLADKEEAEQEFCHEVLQSIPKNTQYGAVIAAVAHRQYFGLSHDFWSQLIYHDGVLVDLKGIMPRSLNALRI
jgi:UDP-N-acetyl-D-galactosamine dehydrogenase